MATEKTQTVLEIKISYQPRIKISDCPIVKTSEEAYLLFRESWDMGMIHLIEHFKIMVLNRANRVRGIFLLATGGMTCVVVDPRVVFCMALDTPACSIILAHNHPSENLKPSQADINLNGKLSAGGKILEIGVLRFIGIIGFWKCP